MTIHSNALGDGGIVVNHYDNLSHTVKLCSMYDTLLACAKLAEEEEINLNLEALNITTDHVGNFLATTQMGAEICRLIGSPRLKLLYDVYHMQINEGCICDTITNYADQFGHISAAVDAHGDDANQKHIHDQAFPGDLHVDQRHHRKQDEDLQQHRRAADDGRIDLADGVEHAEDHILVPGALLGLFVGGWAWMLRAQAESGNTGTALWVASFAGIFVCTGFFTWLLAQVPLVDLPLAQIAKNAGLMFFGFFPRTAAAALVLALYWGATLLYLPATILTILAFGFWLPVTIALMIVYPGLEKVFKLEETIDARRDAEIEERMAQNQPKFDQ